MRDTNTIKRFKDYDLFVEECNELKDFVIDYMGRDKYGSVNIKMIKAFSSFEKSTLFGRYYRPTDTIAIYLYNIRNRTEMHQHAKLLAITVIIHELVHSNRCADTKNDIIFNAHKNYKNAMELDCRLQTMRIFTGMKDILIKRPYLFTEKAINQQIINIKIDILKYYWNMIPDDESIGIKTNDKIREKLNEISDLLEQEDIFKDVPEFGWIR